MAAARASAVDACALARVAAETPSVAAFDARFGNHPRGLSRACVVERARAGGGTLASARASVMDVDAIARALGSGRRGRARAYGGRQFGGETTALGDGRCATLGRARATTGGGWFEVQVKGGGRTAFSRDGDGRATLRSCVKELCVSERLSALDVPTARTAVVVSTNEGVMRRRGNAARLEYGGVSVRVAPEGGFMRFGTFELPASEGDARTVRELADHALEVRPVEIRPGEDAYGAFLRDAAASTASLVARWDAVGFAHGVMNTDNASAFGLTLDLGRSGFMGAYDDGFVSNPDDVTGMFSFGEQRAVARWNVERLCDAFRGVAPASARRDALAAFDDAFANESRALYEKKFGVAERGAVEALYRSFREALRLGSLDFTASHAALGPLASRLVQRAESESPESIVRDVFLARGILPAATAHPSAARSLGAFARRYDVALRSERRDASSRRAEQDAWTPTDVVLESDIDRAVAAACADDDWEPARALAARCARPRPS